MSSLNLALSLLMIPSDSAKSASFWLDKGNELCNSGQMDEALKAYEKALNIDGSLLDAWNNKGLVLASLERYPEAMQCFDEGPQDISQARLLPEQQGDGPVPAKEVPGSVEVL